MNVRRHIPAILQIIASVLFLVESFRAPINVGALGPDNLFIYFLIVVIVTIVSAVIYLIRFSMQSLIPFVIAILTIIALKTGNSIEETIRKENTILVANAGDAVNKFELILFKDNTFEHIDSEPESVHYDRGKYFMNQDSINLDREVKVIRGYKAGVFYKQDNFFYTIINDGYRIDTLKYYIED